MTEEYKNRSAEIVEEQAQVVKQLIEHGYNESPDSGKEVEELIHQISQNLSGYITERKGNTKAIKGILGILKRSIESKMDDVEGMRMRQEWLLADPTRDTELRKWDKERWPEIVGDLKNRMESITDLEARESEIWNWRVRHSLTGDSL